MSENKARRRLRYKHIPQISKEENAEVSNWDR
jgi:hypothetical protein